jgi:hypothetical protein
MEAEGGDLMVTMDFSELEGMLRPILAEAAQVRGSAGMLRGGAALSNCA